MNSLGKLVLDKPDKCDKCDGPLEYLGIGRYKCIYCRNEMLDDYGKIKKYFEFHGPTPIRQVAKETGVSKEKIQLILKG